MLAGSLFLCWAIREEKEGLDFAHNKWIFFIVIAAITGKLADCMISFLMRQFNPMVVQSWYNVYQVFIMCPILALLWWPKRKETSRSDGTGHLAYFNFSFSYRFRLFLCA